MPCLGNQDGRLSNPFKHTFGAEGKYGITPDQTNVKTIDYFRASVREMVLTYPLLAGTAVPSDFVELPSQLYEHWLEVPEILWQYARHCRTGEPMPKALLDRLLATRTYNQGFATVEYTACALVDLDLHSLPDAAALDVTEFERNDLGRIAMPAEIVMRHRLPHFQHLFSGSGYAAGYYSYMWSEVLDADAFAAFEVVP